MSLRQSLLSMGCVLALIGTSGCAQMFAGLRHDSGDQDQSAPYVEGGEWPSHGWLSDDMPMSGNYDRGATQSGRGPASVGGDQNSGGGATWVSQNDRAQNERNDWRGLGPDGQTAPSFSNDPNMAPATPHMYKHGNRATADDFIDQSQNEGSLWASDGQTNYYFTKNRVRSVGDIVTIKVDPEFIKDIGAEVQKTLTPDERDAELQAAQDRLNQQASAAVASSAAGSGAAARAPASVSAPKATDKDIDVSKSLEIKAGDPIMAEIVERYPNGNYKIRGTKKVVYKNGTPRLLTLIAVARGQDIDENDVIQSGKLYEYRLEAFR